MIGDGRYFCVSYGGELTQGVCVVFSDVNKYLCTMWNLERSNGTPETIG